MRDFQLILFDWIVRALREKPQRNFQGLPGGILTLVLQLRETRRRKNIVRDGNTPSTPSRIATCPNGQIATRRPAACWTRALSVDGFSWVFGLPCFPAGKRLDACARILA